MGLNDEIAKAARIVLMRGILPAEQQEIVWILVDAGVEKRLAEQEEIRKTNELLVQKAFSPGIVH